MKKHILSQTVERLEEEFLAWGEQRWRAGQLLDWIYRKHVSSFAACTNLSKTLRQKLEGHFSFYIPPLLHQSDPGDETQKFLWKLEDGSLVESVLLEAPSESESTQEGRGSAGRKTLCLSTQVGCAYGCKFCASGRSGFVRNLTAAEMVEQFLGVERWNRARGYDLPERWISNIVVMGMGEPLANYEELLCALSILNAPWGGGVGARKITISTSGLVPEILRLAAEPEQYRLAISLHGASDEVRSRIMPINRKYPLAALLKACGEYQRAKGRMISFEYILIERLNDTPEQCHGLAAIARRFHAHVNLISYNRVEGCDFSRPPAEVIQRFYRELLSLGVSTTLRQEKGGDLDAACGQLRLRKMQDLAEGPFPS
ncbi:MAG: 23S rRNA (adenine(2503)-C(2))-methyltransferase RlmN [Limisphaerales bacterium]|jgi:23S rRNA (adenine2503-C2)-methyltransferase|nr:23S rRNA (adenine(2503)-C(2))-methyltransferase RlmN [Verrucomicrobiota bacterium]